MWVKFTQYTNLHLQLCLNFRFFSLSLMSKHRRSKEFLRYLFFCYLFLTGLLSSACENLSVASHELLVTGEEIQSWKTKEERV